jgi:hypothetical protein
MKNETQVFFLERTIEVETKIRIEKEKSKYFAYVYDDLSQDTRKIECWIEDDYTGSLMTEECNTEAEYDAVIDSFKAFILANGIKYARMCDKCNEGMNEGYLVNGGDEYYCSAECLHQVYTPKEWQDMYDESEENGGNDNYWTQWEEDVDYAYVLFNNQLIEI